KSSKSTPKMGQNIAEWIIESIYNLIYSVTGSHKKTAHFFPLIATFLLFILCNNWFGLLPGVGTIGFYETVTEEHAQAPALVDQAHAAELAQDDHAAEPTHEETLTVEEHPTAEEATGAHTEEATTQVFVPLLRAGTADLNTTLALALISVFMTQIIGFQYQQFGYFTKFFNFSSPIMFFVGILELVSEFAKIISFAFRLFGNIFAGEVLLAVISFLVPLLVPMPFYGLEVFVGFIQALVFAMLSLVFFNMATQGHEAH
ncbi:MAG TPA: F0F1 ATP synthase subunit A, partial [Patescibacteria group bacterium]